eukprot:357163-Chlamydomonas_euryale.AAC.7
MTVAGLRSEHGFLRKRPSARECGMWAVILLRLSGADFFSERRSTTNPDGMHLPGRSSASCTCQHVQRHAMEPTVLPHVQHDFLHMTSRTKEALGV